MHLIGGGFSIAIWEKSGRLTARVIVWTEGDCFVW